MNISGTAILLDILANTKHSVKKVVVAESRAIYGEGRYYSEELKDYVYPTLREEKDMSEGDFEVKYPNCHQPLKLVGTTENSLIHPTSVYGITKQVQGQLVHLVCSSIGIAAVSYRYQNVYGPGQSLSNPYTGILSIFSTRIKSTFLKMEKKPGILSTLMMWWKPQFWVLKKKKQMGMFLMSEQVLLLMFLLWPEL